MRCEIYCIALSLLLFSSDQVLARGYSIGPIMNSKPTANSHSQGNCAISTQPASSTAIDDSEQSKDPMLVYGNSACGWTKKYMKELQQAGIPFLFKDLSNPKVDKEFSDRANKAGMSGSIPLPVIFVNGKMSARPDLATLIKSKKR